MWSIKRTPLQILLSYRFAFGLVVFCACAFLMIQTIHRSSSSTAALGYLFIPFWALIYSTPAFLAGALLDKIKLNTLNSSHKALFLNLLGGALISLIVGGYVYFLLQGFSLSKKVLEIQNMDSADLAQTLQNSNLKNNKFILGAIASNPQTPAETLDQIAQIQNNDLHSPLGSLFFDVLGGNRKGLAVMRLVARHNNVTTETLEILAKSQDDYVLSDVVANKKISESNLRRILNKGGYLIEWGASSNPSTPSELLAILAKSSNEYTRANVARNPNTRSSDLTLLSEDANWNVRGQVALNPSSSLETVAKLSKDLDERVRRYALERSQKMDSK